jgi:hypothetical protein
MFAPRRASSVLNATEVSAHEATGALLNTHGAAETSTGQTKTTPMQARGLTVLANMGAILPECVF